MKRNQLALIFFLLLGLSLSACSSIGLGASDPTPTAIPQSASPTSNDVIAEGHVEPLENKYLGFAVAGRIAELLVANGDEVSQGQTLARLANSEEAQARLDSANLEIETAQQALDELQRTAEFVNSEAWVTLVKANQAVVTAQKAYDDLDTQQTQDDIDEASAEVADAEKTLNDARRDFEPYEDLPEDNTQRKDAQQTLDDAEQVYSEAVLKRDVLINSLELAEASLEQAKQAQVEAQFQYNQTTDGADPDQVKLAEARLLAAQSAQAAAQSALDELELKAPFAGTVMDVNVIVDELTNPGDWIVLIADQSQWYVRTSDLTELEVVNLEEGQKVEMVPDALPDVTLTGTVEQISQTYRSQTGDIVYDVLIRLDQFDPRLRWGMTVEANFLEK
jgi:multidrug efflux pump subunit AcrA (membrane-fusion protein)